MEKQQTNIPEYISKEFLEKALQNGLNCKNLTVSDAKIVSGTNVGDNYCSEIYRANVKYIRGIKTESISLIIKAMPFLEHRGPALNELEVFEKELQMYMETLPQMSRLINDEFLCAKCFYATSSPVQLIVFQDLKEIGFVMADRHAGLDDQHCKLVLEKLAKLHASSYALAKIKPNSMDKYSFGLIKPNALDNSLLKAIFEKGLETLADIIKTWPGYERVANKLKTITDDFINKLEKKTIEQNDTCLYKVLNHGDFWVNNFLFKYEEGTPKEVVFVDFQMSYYSSPGIDLNYFVHTSPNNHVRENRTATNIETYYIEFARILNNLNVKDVPTLTDLQKEIKRCEYYGFMAAVGILPILILNKDASEESHLDKMGDEEQGKKIRQAMYLNSSYQIAIKPILKRFDEHNILDDLVNLN